MAEGEKKYNGWVPLYYEVRQKGLMESPGDSLEYRELLRSLATHPQSHQFLADLLWYEANRQEIANEKGETFSSNGEVRYSSGYKYRGSYIMVEKSRIIASGPGIPGLFNQADKFLTEHGEGSLLKWTKTANGDYGPMQSDEHYPYITLVTPPDK